ncbi:hypothetical protein HSX11_18150 [Oxalobacteraceae bacterium]|nr:hypothetical protein [Oxalobacteraceae bacterium]
MTLLLAGLASAASADTIELQNTSLNQEAAKTAAAVDNTAVYLAPLGEVDDAEEKTAQPGVQAQPAPQPVPEPEHYGMLILGAALLLVCSRRSEARAPFSYIRVKEDKNSI